MADFIFASQLAGLVYDNLPDDRDRENKVSARVRFAAALVHTGRAREAVPILEHALQQRTDDLGAGDPDTLWTRYRLGTTAYSAGHAYQALDHLEHLLHEATPDTPPEILLAARRRHAFVRRSVGEAHEADSVYQVLVNDYRQHYGDQHLQTLRTISEHAVVQRNLAHFDEAERLLDHCLNVRADRGKDHPDRWHDLARLAGIWRATGLTDQAAAEFAAIYEHWCRELGEHHPWTLLAGNNLAVTRAHTCSMQNAIDLLHDVCTAHANSAGHGLPRALNARHNLACLYATTGDVDASIDGLRTVYSARIDMLGPEHPDTTTSRTCLSVVFTHAGEHDAAQGVLGDDERHPTDAGNRISAWAAGHSTDETITLRPEDLTGWGHEA